MQSVQLSLENFIMIFKSLMQRQTDQTEQNYQLLMCFKKQQPQNFIRYLCQIILNDQYYKAIGLQAIVVLNKALMEGQQKASEFVNLPEEEQHTYTHCIFNRIINMQQYIKPIDDCIVGIIRDFLLGGKKQEAKIIIEFINQALQTSSNNLVMMQQIGQILQNITELEPKLLLELIDIQSLLGYIKLLLQDQKLHQFYIQSLMNIIMNVDQFELQHNLNDDALKYLKDQIMADIFQCVLNTSNEEMLKKFMQKFVKLTEIFEVMEMLSNYYDNFLEMLEYVISINQSESMYIYVIQILSNTMYAGGQVDPYTIEQIEKSKQFYAQYIFTYMENHIDIIQQNQTFLMQDYGSDIFDQNSLESAFTEFCSQIYCQLLDSIYDVIEAFIEQPAQNQQGRLYTTLWIIISMLKSDKYYQDHINKIIIYLVNHAANIKNNIQINQYLIIYAMQEVVATHGKNKAAIKLIINHHINQLIIEMAKQIQEIQNNNQVFQQLLAFMRRIFKTERYKQFAIMTQFLQSLPQLLQSQCISLQSSVLRTMSFIVKQNAFINNDVIQSYLVYFEQSCKYIISATPSISIHLQLTLIDHYINNLKFIQRVLYIYHSNPSINQQLIQETIHHICSLFKYKDLECVHGLIPKLIKFVYNILPLFPDYFKSHLEYIQQAYIQIIQQDIYNKPGIFDNSMEDQFKSHITKWQQFAYKAMGVLFLNYPDQFSQCINNLLELFGQKKDMGIFTKVDQIQCIFSSLNCYYGEQCLIQFNNLIQSIEYDLPQIQCSSTFTHYIKSYNIVLDIMCAKSHQDQMIAHYCQKIVSDSFDILMKILDLSNDRFQQYLNEQEENCYDDDNDTTSVDSERDEFCNLHAVVQAHLIKMLTMSWPDQTVYQLLKTKMNERLNKTSKEIVITIINVIFATCSDVDDRQRINIVKKVIGEFIKSPETMLYRHEIIFILENMIQYTDELVSEQLSKYIESLYRVFKAQESENIIYVNICNYIIYFEVLKKSNFQNIDIARKIDEINNRIIISMKLKYMGRYLLKQMQFGAAIKGLTTNNDKDISSSITRLSYFEKLLVMMLNNCEKQDIINHLDYIKQSVVVGGADFTKIQKAQVLSNNGLENASLFFSQQ